MGDTGPLGERFIDNKKFEGTIPELLEDTLGFIRRNIKTKTTENRFSGIPTIYNEMEKANHRPPIFENKRGTFKVILYNEVNLSLSEIESEIIEFCNTGKSRDYVSSARSMASSGSAVSSIPALQ